MHRFHIPPGTVNGAEVLLSPEESHHALRVLRFASGLMRLFLPHPALSMNRVAQPSRLRVHAASRRAHYRNRAGRPGNPQAGAPAPQLRLTG